MTREEIAQEVIAIPNKSILLELATGVGKSKLALTLADKYIQEVPEEDRHILIVYPMNTLQSDWKAELKKWNMEHLLPYITFTHYASLHKHVTDKDGNIIEYTCCIFDECFKGDTEILTEKGYIPFKDLQPNIKVAQFTDTGNIEFVYPIRLIHKHHQGQICKVHLGRNRFVYMTPNHNQVYRNRRNNYWEIKNIKDLNLNSTIRIPVSGKGSGNNTPLSILERIYIAIQADGTLQRHQLKESVYSIQITKERKKERLAYLLSKYNKYSVIKGRPETDRYLIKIPKGDAKLLSTHFNINMGYDRAASFIEEVLEWDGSHLQGNIKYYSSKIKENADFVAAIAVQAGYKVFQSEEVDNRKDNYSTMHRVYMRPNTEDVSAERMYKEYEDYNDDVFCVEVPSHKIVVRSQGYTFISGNCHHLSDLKKSIFKKYHSKHNILLSATVGRNLKKDLQALFNPLYIYKVPVKTAIEEEILPDPIIIKIPISLKEIEERQVWVINPKAKNHNNRCWPLTKSTYWKLKKEGNKNFKYGMVGTAVDYDKLQNQLIDFYKNKGKVSIVMRNIHIRMCGDRLDWYAKIKTPFVSKILALLKYHKTLTFCTSIEQADALGKNAIHSKNKKATEIKEAFNEGKIKHITAVEMLTEGANLTGCKFGIWARYNTSETKIPQKIGRILRHKTPYLILPYFIGTKEEKIVETMCETVGNKDRIITTTISNLLNVIK